MSAVGRARKVGLPGLLVALVALHVVAALAVAALTDWDVPGFTTGDNLQYQALVDRPGVPYRDIEVAFPPVTLGYLELVSWPDDPTVAAWLLVLTQLAADLAVAAALAYGWSPTRAAAWLALLLPLCWGGWIFARVDLLSVALALWGWALARRRREVAGGGGLALAVLAKAWPLVTAPALWIEQRPRAVRAFAVTLVVAGAAWLLLGGVSGVLQVGTFRGAAGYQVESTAGSLLLLDGARDVFEEAGALRIGSQPAWARVLTPVVLLVTIAGAWLLARRASLARPAQDSEVAELACIAAVGSLLVLSPLLSPQYLVWVLPYLALRWRDGWLPALGAAAGVLTVIVASRYDELLDAGREGLARVVVARNALLVAVVVLALVRLVRAGAPLAVSAPDAACTARRTRR